MRLGVFAGMLLAGTVLGTPVLAATIEVRPGDNLEAKIHSARAGDTVAVYRGTYNGSLDLSNLHGDPGAPIRILSADGKGAAVIRGSRNQAAVQANRITNVEINGFHVIADAPGGGDVGGFKLWGSYGNIGNLKVANNLITGEGQDGFKLFNMSPTDQQSVLVAGNTIDGHWRQEAIDNVSVRNVRYEGNTIKGKAGFAGITWKAGSDGVQLVNNTIDIDADTAVSVGGYGNSRLNRMDQFPEEFQGNEAENSVVTGNDIRGDVRVVSAENNRIEGNNISGGISNGQNSHMPGSMTSRNNIIENNRAAGGTGASAWDGSTDSQFERNVDGLADNFYNTDDQFWRAVERGEAGAVRRLNDLVSGGIILREGNRIINRATGQVTSAVNNTIGDAVDTVLQPIEDYVDSAVETVKCNIGGAVIGGAASVVSGIFSGGRATLAAQIAQQMTAIAGNLCLGKQLATQQRQLAEQRKMTQRLEANAAAGVSAVEEAARSQLGSIDQDLYGADADGVMQGRYQEGMPESWTFEDAGLHMDEVRARTSDATREAARTQAAARASIDAALDMSDEALGLSQGAVGQTQAIQAQTQMLRTQIAVDAARQAGDAAIATAMLRTTEEQRVQEIIADQKVRRLYGPGSLEPRTPTGRALFQ